jgi:HAD superfamily hydrolase (TIGR01509 family)
VRALIFDYDGVIVDSESCAARLAVQMMADRGIEVAFNDLARFVGASRRDDDAFETWLGRHLGDDAGIFNTLLWEKTDVALQELEVRPGVERLLKSARGAGWKVGIGSGQARHRVYTGLRRLGLLDLFEQIVTGDDAPRGKPAPDIYLEAARRLGVEPKDCIVIEDSTPGCEAAIAAGMRVIACPCELTASSTFPAEARVVRSLEDLVIAEL